MRVGAPVRRPLTAAIVGSTCRLRLCQIRTVASGHARLQETARSAIRRKRADGGRQNARQHHSTEYADGKHCEEFYRVSRACIGYMLPEIDLLSRPKDSALPSRYI